ncbi:MAG: hypothetical protein NXH89_03520 [Cyclobacteriaceae bacterium]|uniref:Secreted protein n=1 Tax=Algoriphagus marincola TaxID=264027 RepID=A0ABS7N8X4_9BACT|nr:hypothetical protein [Algoriphagus marincola]MBY5952343.1 hypothetical protein [Algoriphagus marincola]MCR9081462.1 hypothetical protein [Cyclobacteriaceae bacterium]
MKKLIFTGAIALFSILLLSVSPTENVIAQRSVETGHWVPYYGGNPTPIKEICAGSGSQCILEDTRPPQEQ